MTYWGDLCVVFCLYGWAYCIGAWLGHRRVVETFAVGQLVGLTGIMAFGWLLCLIGYAPHAGPWAPFEALPMHKTLGPVVYMGGPLGCVVWARRLWPGRDIGTAIRPVARRHGVLSAPGVACAIGLAGFVLTAWVWTLGPCIRPDEAMYHVSLPLQYLGAGGYTVVRGHGNAGFFALGDMLFWWCLVAGAPGAARQMQLLVALVGWAALVTQAPALLRLRRAWAFVLWLGAPVVLWDLSAAYVDVMEASMSLVGIMCLARWYKADLGRDAYALGQAAWLLGAAAASRQMALSMLPVLALVVLWRLRQAEQTANFGRVCAQCAACCSLALILPLMFVLHNLYVFDNPVYPFLPAVFGSRLALWPSQNLVLEQFLAQHGPVQGAVLRTGLDALWHLPYALLFDAAFASPKFDGVIGLMPLVAACVGIWHRWGTPTACALAHVATAPTPADVGQERLLGRLLLLFAAMRTLVWLSTSWQARFVIMPLGALGLWTTSRWPRWRDLGATGRAVYGLLVAGCVVCICVAQATLMGHTPPWDVRYLGSGAQRRAARLAQVPQSALCDALLAKPFAGRLMLVWTQRLAVYCPMPLWSDSYDESATLTAWLDAGPAADVAARLQASEIGHLLVDMTAFDGMLTDDSGLDPATCKLRRARWDALVTSALDLVDTRGAVRLYAVKPG